MKATLEQLGQRIARWTEFSENPTTAIEQLNLFRRAAPSEPVNGLYQPSVCLVAQGAKRVLLGEESLVYDGERFLITSVHLPTIVQITEASAEKPYLGLSLRLDPREISELMLDTSLPTPSRPAATLGMAVGRTTPELLDAFVRLLDLLDHEADIPILAPMIRREITYRLLVGEQGARLRQIATAGTRSHAIAHAIDWLQHHYTEALRIEDLAQRANMSASTFHHHFRQLTTMSPLQYQKKLRLNEARRLLLTERLDASTTAFRVGYESASQFSREYRRLFGAPPVQDRDGLLGEGFSSAV